MRVVADSTEEVVHFDGVECRVWNATTDDGQELQLLVHRIAVPSGSPLDIGLAEKFGETDPPRNVAEVDEALARARGSDTQAVRDA